MLDYFPAFRYRDFRIFWFGQMISLVGSWMQVVVQPYLAYRLTGQPIYLGWVGFASAMPMFILAIPAGALIERLDKRKVVIAMQTVMMCQAFTLAFLALNNLVTIWHIIALACIQGIANALEITARQAMFIDLVGKDALPNAIALNSMVFNVARIVGPSIAAPFLILLKDTGEGWAFFANGVSYLFVIGGLLLIRSIPTLPAMQRGVEKRWLRISDVADGFRYVRKDVIIALLIMTVTLPSLLAFPFVQILPAYVQGTLLPSQSNTESLAAGISMLLSAQGVGALIAALMLAVFSTNRNKGLWLMLGQFIFATSLVGLGLSRSVSQAMPFMAFNGLGMVFQLSITNTLIQLDVPDALRGRVISIFIWAVQGIAPFGSLLLAGMVQRFGASTSIMISGLICALGYCSIHIYKPALRRMKR